MAERFRELFPTPAEFDAFFPAISGRTDLVAARQQEAAQQLGCLDRAILTENKNATESNSVAFLLVAGEGFEPPTFGL